MLFSDHTLELQYFRFRIKKCMDRDYQFLQSFYAALKSEPNNSAAVIDDNMEEFLKSTARLVSTGGPLDRNGKRLLLVILSILKTVQNVPSGLLDQLTTIIRNLNWKKIDGIGDSRDTILVLNSLEVTALVTRLGVNYLLSISALLSTEILSNFSDGLLLGLWSDYTDSRDVTFLNVLFSELKRRNLLRSIRVPILHLKLLDPSYINLVSKLNLFEGPLNVMLTFLSDSYGLKRDMYYLQSFLLICKRSPLKENFLGLNIEKLLLDWPVEYSLELSCIFYSNFELFQEIFFSSKLDPIFLRLFFKHITEASLTSRKGFLSLALKLVMNMGTFSLFFEFAKNVIEIQEFYFSIMSLCITSLLLQGDNKKKIELCLALFSRRYPKYKLTEASYLLKKSDATQIFQGIYHVQLEKVLEFYNYFQVYFSIFSGFTGSHYDRIIKDFLTGLRDSNDVLEELSAFHSFQLFKINPESIPEISFLWQKIMNLKDCYLFNANLDLSCGYFVKRRKYENTSILVSIQGELLSIKFTKIAPRPIWMLGNGPIELPFITSVSSLKLLLQFIISYEEKDSLEDNSQSYFKDVNLSLFIETLQWANYMGWRQLEFIIWLGIFRLPFCCCQFNMPAHFKAIYPVYIQLFNKLHSLQKRFFGSSSQGDFH